MRSSALDDLVGGERAAELDPALELGDQPRHRFVSAQITPCVLARRRMLRAVSVAEHARGGRTQTFQRRRRFAQLLDDRERIAVQRKRLGLDAVVRVDRASTEAPLEEIRLRSRHAGVRRTQEAVELSAAAAEPHEAEQAEQRAAERRLRQPRPRGDRDRDSERAEPGFERRAPALERGTDDCDLLRSRPAADQSEHFLADEL